MQYQLVTTTQGLPYSNSVQLIPGVEVANMGTHMTVTLSLRAGEVMMGVGSFLKGVVKVFKKMGSAIAGFVSYASGLIDRHPYAWMAIKATATIVTTLLCPACAAALLAIKATFVAIDSIASLVKLSQDINSLPAGLSDEAKAACSAYKTSKTLISIGFGITSIFVPVFPTGVGDIAGQLSDAIGSLPIDTLLMSQEAAQAIADKSAIALKDVAVPALVSIAEKVGADAIAKKADDTLDTKVFEKLNAKGAKYFNFDCTAAKAAADEADDSEQSFQEQEPTTSKSGKADEELTPSNVEYTSPLKRQNAMRCVLGGKCPKPLPAGEAGQ
jgi:hypothetical protein